MKSRPKTPLCSIALVMIINLPVEINNHNSQKRTINWAPRQLSWTMIVCKQTKTLKHHKKQKVWNKHVVCGEGGGERVLAGPYGTGCGTGGRLQQPDPRPCGITGWVGRRKQRAVCLRVEESIYYLILSGLHSADTICSLM